MNREELIGRLKELGFAKEDYWLITGGAMVLYGLRSETGDIDLGCTAQLADQMESKGVPVTIMSDGTRKICPAQDVEMFEGWLYDKVEMMDGVPVISLNGLLSMKKALGREKDLRDIQLIEDVLAAAENHL